MVKTISSLQNPFIKQLVQLKEKSKLRKQTGLFIIEGKREVSLAIKGNYTLETLYYYADLFSASEAAALEAYGIDIIEISKPVYEKVAHREIIKTITTSKKEIKIAVKGGYIYIDELKVSGKKKLDSKSLLNGYSFSSNAEML